MIGAVAASGMVLLAACGAGRCASGADGPRVCEGAEVVVEAGSDVGCDVRPPMVLTVRYPGSDGIEEAKFLADCDDSGGDLEWSHDYDEAGEFVCRDVDY